MKIGIVGTGTIGTAVIENVLAKYKDRLQSVIAFDMKVDKLRQAKDKFPFLNTTNSLSSLVRRSNFIIETASGNCVRQLMPLIIKYKRDILVMSTGGLLNKKLLLEKAIREGLEVIIPGGAIGGLDVIKAIKNLDIRDLLLSTYKPVSALGNAPYVQRKKINLKRIRNEKLIFEGGVKEAIKGFPKSINVSATLLLVSGLKDIRVRIYASPSAKNITHIIDIKSQISDLHFVFKNYSSKSNPKTSALAIYSASWETERYILKHLKRR